MTGVSNPWVGSIVFCATSDYTQVDIHRDHDHDYWSLRMFWLSIMARMLHPLIFSNKWYKVILMFVKITKKLPSCLHVLEVITINPSCYLPFQSKIVHILCACRSDLNHFYLLEFLLNSFLVSLRNERKHCNDSQ